MNANKKVTRDMVLAIYERACADYMRPDCSERLYMNALSLLVMLDQSPDCEPFRDDFLALREKYGVV